MSKLVICKVFLYMLMYFAKVLCKCSRSQFATLNKNNNSRGNNIKYLPYVLTEQGIMMLSGLLKSDIAVRVNIQIIDAFVKMRKYFVKSTLTSEMLINHENRILKLEDTFNRFNEKKEINKIFLRENCMMLIRYF